MQDSVGTIRTVDGPATTTLLLAGEIDAAFAPQAETAVAAALAAGRPVDLDLGGVTFIDSTGVRLVIRCWLACRDAGIDLRIQHVPEQARSVLSMMGLLGSLPVVPAAA